MKICPACSREYGDEHESCLDDGVVLVRLDTGTTTRGQDLIGKVIDGRYRIERIVGRGGMGTVYACRHVVVGKPFAMKVLRPGIERSEEILQRFIREAQSANAVQSRHICEMTDFGQLPGGAFYVVMELLNGGSLTRALREKRLDRVALKHVFVQICETLFRAHNANIIHRDLKPDNVVLIEDEGDPNFVKLVDFGIAKMMESKASNLTETGVILGTPYYMSPEQARGDDLDHRSDIYALGVMMYRAFTGRLPFVADTAMGVLTRHLTEKPELPSRITDIDPQLEHLILRCLEKKPIDRFQTMLQVANALMSITDEPKPAPAASAFDEQTDTGKNGPPRVGMVADPTPTRLASPMAKSQRQEAWDGGNRAQASSAPVPGPPPPRPRSNPPTEPHIPAAVPLPTPPPHAAHGAPQQPPRQQQQYAAGSPHLPYPHHLTPQAFAQQSSVSSGSHVIPSGLHPVHQPVTGSMLARPGMTSEPLLPAHLQGEAATNRGVSSRIGTAPQPGQRRWPLFAGAAAVLLIGAGIGAVALTNGSDDPKPAASSEPTSPDQEAETPSTPTGTATSTPQPGTTTDPSATVAPTPSASASSSAKKVAPRPQSGHTTVRPRPQPGGDDGGDDKPKPKPVDDVRDPFDE